MTVSRRHFLQGSTVVAATLTSTASLMSSPMITTTESAFSTTATPSPEAIALHRMGFGPRPGDIAAVQAMGLTAYIDQQLNPAAIDDSACETRITNARMRIEYGSVNELRPLTCLAKTTPEAWDLFKNTSLAWQERQRPTYEVMAATWLRAIYSKRQLKEVLVDFWHNHFNVAPLSDLAISTTFAVYDRDVIRPHCLGNFRALLEAVTKSTGLMYYLDNVSNRVGGVNENFSRELLELHTLGVDSYINSHNDRSQIGTFTYRGISYAKGYIEQDVADVARCFTGWTINNGSLGDGTFYYNSGWHDQGAKTVLSPTGTSNIPSGQPALKDGLDVLTILASHPNTARHVCTKLCRRFISDTPPTTVVDAAVATWMDYLNSPDQLRYVMRTILTSIAFTTTWGQKLKRPFEAFISYFRATNAELALDTLTGKYGAWEVRFYYLRVAGQGLFEWLAPNGYPDHADFWINTDRMLWCWNVPFYLTSWWGGDVRIDLVAQTNMSQSCIQIVDFWIGRLCGFSIDPAIRDILIAFMAQGADPAQPPKPLPGHPDYSQPAALVDRLNAMVHLLAAVPDFHSR